MSKLNINKRLFSWLQSCMSFGHSMIDSCGSSNINITIGEVSNIRKGVHVHSPFSSRKYGYSPYASYKDARLAIVTHPGNFYDRTIQPQENTPCGVGLHQASLNLRCDAYFNREGNSLLNMVTD